ncbi:MAG: hypothetical protein R3244_00180 [Thermoanaerobaculia bacterium]|nr:hypothetical protein [Thermoanaerobaculia bacterium]
MDERPLPPDLRRRIVERGCAYLAAIGRTLDPPEDASHFAARATPDDRPRAISLLERLRSAASQLFGLS